MLHFIDLTQPTAEFPFYPSRRLKLLCSNIAECLTPWSTTHIYSLHLRGGSFSILKILLHKFLQNGSVIGLPCLRAGYISHNVLGSIGHCSAGPSSYRSWRKGCLILVTGSVICCRVSPKSMKPSITIES